MAHGPWQIRLWKISVVPPSLDALSTCLFCLMDNPPLVASEFIPHAQMFGNLGIGRSYRSTIASLNSSLFRLNPASFRGSADSHLDAPFSRHISILFFSYNPSCSPPNIFCSSSCWSFSLCFAIPLLSPLTLSLLILPSLSCATIFFVSCFVRHTEFLNSSTAALIGFIIPIPPSLGGSDINSQISGLIGHPRRSGRNPLLMTSSRGSK